MSIQIRDPDELAQYPPSNNVLVHSKNIPVISHNLMHLQFSINAKKIKNQFTTKLENLKSLEDFFWSEIMA